MVKQALRHISEHRREGDLLMDVPPSLSWAELCQVAANRDAWRAKVHSLRNGSAVSVTMNNSLPGRRAARRPATTRQRQAPPTFTNTASPRARKYITRYTHEAFFRPADSQRPKPKAKKRKRKPKPWTNKQRQALAREQYELHHGRHNSNESHPPTPVTPIPTSTSPEPWSPKIMGHHNRGVCPPCDPPPQHHPTTHTNQVG